MNILVVGDNARLAECKEKFGPFHQYTLASDHQAAFPLVKGDGIVFDFEIDRTPKHVEMYRHTSRVVFLNTVKTTLRKLGETTGSPLPGELFGFNGLPGFLNNPVLEISMLPTSRQDLLNAMSKELGCEFIVVEDRVGLVSPRVICMIINEAYFTIEDRTASREDIDLAMKLGTNYPYGPFEWCRKIGIPHVYELLEALFQETKDDRYKISSLLEDEYRKVAGLSSNISPV